MNINPNAVKVLCYGDSNTWGYIPGLEARYPVNLRWTGLLQQMLGANFWIIEEGLNGRTTNVEDPDSPGKNGLAYLTPCLKTHNPIDLIILMLGTNDTKYKFQRSPDDIAFGIASMIDEIKEIGWDRDGNMPRIILLSPPLVNDKVEKALEEFKDAGDRSKHFFQSYKPIAEKYSISLFDVASWISPSNEDGVHLESEDHRIIAEELFPIVTSMMDAENA